MAFYEDGALKLAKGDDDSALEAAVNELVPDPALLDSVVLRATTVTHRGLAILGDFPGLRHVYLDRTVVGGSELSVVAGIFRLETLTIDDCRIDDKAFVKLNSAINLKELRAKSNGLTDNALRDLSALPQLALLDIENNPITDTGVVYLRRHPALDTVGLRATQVTRGVAVELRDSLCVGRGGKVFFD